MNRNILSSRFVVSPCLLHATRRDGEFLEITVSVNRTYRNSATSLTSFWKIALSTTNTIALKRRKQTFRWVICDYKSIELQQLLNWKWIANCLYNQWIILSNFSKKKRQHFQIQVFQMWLFLFFMLVDWMCLGCGVLVRTKEDIWWCHLWLKETKSFFIISCYFIDQWLIKKNNQQINLQWKSLLAAPMKYIGSIRSG